MADISDIMSYLPTAGANKSIAVGFENIDALAPLKVLLDDYVKKTSDFEKKLNDENKKNQDKQEKKIEEIYNNVAKQIISEQVKQLAATKEEINELKKQSSAIEEANDKISKSINLKENKEDFKLLKQRLKRIVNATLDVLDKHLDNAIELGNVYTDIESSGVFLSNGFKDLGEVTNKLGMTHQELASHLKKTSPLIARLNGSMGNGLKSFESAISGIDDRLNLTNKEKVAIFENVISNLSPDQLLKMTQEQMNMEINKTAKEMKMLSMATGKAVDLINQENAQKEATQRQQVWKRTHKASFNVLKALGLDKDQEMMDYIMSGGTKATANILTRMQNDPFMQKVLPQMIRMANTNQLNMGTAANLYNQNKHLVGYKSSYANRASFDPSMLAAAISSDYFQNAAFNDTFGEAFMKMNLNGDMASQYFSNARADANGALSNHIGLTRAMGRYDAAKLEALSGGEQGVKNSTGVGEWLYNKGSGIINGYNNIIGKIPFLGGTLSGLGASTIAVNKEQIFSAAVDRFAAAVSIFASSQLFNSFGGSVKDFSLGGSWRGLKNSNGKWQIPFKSTPWKSLSNAAKFGKVAGGVGSVLTAGVGAYDTIQNYDTLKKEGKLSESIGSNIGTLIGGIGGTILGGPVGAIFGSWLGDKVGGLAGKGIGWASDKISNWWNNDNKTEIKTPSNSQINHLNDSQNYTSKNMKLLEDSVLYSKRTSESIQQLIDKATEGNKIQENKITYDKTKGEYQN